MGLAALTKSTAVLFETLSFLPWLTESYISARFLTRGLLIALMMEAARTSETLVNSYQTTRRYNPEDSHLQIKEVLQKVEYQIKDVLQSFFLVY
jgi:hypothetical protein